MIYEFFINKIVKSYNLQEKEFILKKSLLFIFVSFLLVGCAQQNKNVEPSNKNNLTVGLVQKEIKSGMTQGEVAAVLGSPNIVSSTEKDNETWIYDKINSNVSYKKSESGIFLILVGAGSESGNASLSEKTLTVIIKFNKGKVHDIKYHTTSF